jgi:glucuronate isomerase
MVFNDANFMLHNEPAKRLYQAIEEAPIFDFHCHLNPKEIYEDKVYEDIVDLWLGGDHYKWRLMRANGVPESHITGDAPKLEKFKAWIETVSKAYGNPLYHWSHLEMQKIFGISSPLVPEKAESLYYQLNQYLKEKRISPRSLIKAAKVHFIGTTDHPLDDLVWHKKIKEDSTFNTVVAPTFRPDEAFVEHPKFATFIQELEAKQDCKILSFKELILALEQRIAYFAQLGCRASDISFTEIVYEPVMEDELNTILLKAREGETLSNKEIYQWQTGLFRSLCRLYKEADFITQVHFGALRNTNTELYQRLGADIGVDSTGDQVSLARRLNLLLDDLVVNKSLPKMIWYNLNPVYNTVLANTLANFQDNEYGIHNQLQFGAAWWFNDTKKGMLDQLEVYANQSLLANFVGMLTDSRSFLSFPRHDYFRRILATYVGQWIVDEEIPADYEALGRFMKDIAYDNAVSFFVKN